MKWLKNDDTKGKHRMDIYDPNTDLSRPERVGIMHSKGEFDLATPNLERCENVTIFGSNSSSKETLVVKLKWRPVGAPSKLVTYMSRLYFSTSEGKCYEADQIETYEPQHVVVHSIESGDSMRILQYGSRASSLKLYIPSPFRRVRLVFIGLVHDKADKNKKTFLRLTCIFNATAKLFDFLDQYNEQCVRQMYESKQSPKVRSLNEIINGLLLHDRIDQRCRMKGEYLLFEGQERLKKNLSLWGFHCRHFVSPAMPRGMRTKRIYSYMINGQSYMIGNNKLDSDDISYGYTSFMNQPVTEPIPKPFVGIDWLEQVNENMQKFQFDITGQMQTFTSKTIARRPFSVPDVDKFIWFLVETNKVAGFAWVSLDDELVDTADEMESIERSRNERELALDAGHLAKCSSNNTTDALFVGLDEPDSTNSDVVGSKASSLALLTRLQQQLDKDSASVRFKVSRGFVTTKRAHQIILDSVDGLSDKIKQLEQQASSGANDRLVECCDQLVDYVKNSPLPEQIGDEMRKKLHTCYDDKQGNTVKFAVRSSSWGEDEDDMSAAGQLSTILNVPYVINYGTNSNDDGQALARAIMECFASKFSRENIEYKRQRGMPFNMPMSVVVQEMVQCDKAGVMFTCDPTNGNPSVLTITANYGLGESVVSGQTDPDLIRVRTLNDGEPQIEQIDVGKKNIIIADQQQQQQQKSHDTTKCCLNNDEIIQLSKCAIKVRQYFWSQQRDIEWGIWFDNENEMNSIYLFQSRPVTGLETMSSPEILDESSLPSPAELSYFSRANVGEVMPYACTPLSLTSNIMSWHALGIRLYTSLMKKSEGRREFVPHCTTDVYYERYHTYFNCRSSGFLDWGTSDDSTRSLIGKSMEIGLFGREMGPQPEIVEASRGFTKPPNLWEGPRFMWAFKSLMLMPMRTVLKQRPVMESLRDDVRSGKHVQSKPGDPKRLIELFQLMGHAMGYLETAWFNHIVNITQGSKQNVFLTGFLSKYIKDPKLLTAATNKFLAISPDVISAEIPERIEQMAKLIEMKGKDELAKFLSLDMDESLDYCKDKTKSNNEQLAQKFHEYLHRFGHRAYNEFELQSKSWREQPEKIVEMIKMNCKSKFERDNSKGQLNNFNEQKAKTIDQVIESLPELKDMKLIERMLLKYRLAPKSQLLLSVREQTKDIITYHSDVMREISRMLGEELRRQLRLPDEDLLYYLFYDELLQVCFENSPKLVMTASFRRQYFKQHLIDKPWKYDEIFSDLTPNHLKPNPELDASVAHAPKLYGTPASSGRVQGKICLVAGYNQLNKVRAGSILLTHSTDIAFSPVFPLISGIITEVGGLISHGAVVAREYGLPSLIGIPNVTQILQDNEEIILDADNGTIVRLDKQQSQEAKEQKEEEEEAPAAEA